MSNYHGYKVFSIEGNIGAGKTTIIELLKDKLINDENIIFVSTTFRESPWITTNFQGFRAPWAGTLIPASIIKFKSLLIFCHHNRTNT